VPVSSWHFPTTIVLSFLRLEQVARGFDPALSIRRNETVREYMGRLKRHEAVSSEATF